MERELSLSRGLSEGNSLSSKSLRENSSKSLSRSSTLARDGVLSGSLGKKSKSKNVFHCPIENCGRVFDRKYNMQIHIRKHTGEMPYQCSVEGCGLRFKWRSSLVNHNRKHRTGKLPGDPDPTLPGAETDVERLVSSQDEIFERQQTDPGVIRPQDRDIPFSSSMDVLRPAVQGSRFAGDVAISNVSQALGISEQEMASQPLQVAEYHVEGLYPVSGSPPLEQQNRVLSEVMDPMAFVDATDLPAQEHEENMVDPSFLERFNGALNCDFESYVVEEVLEHPFESPVSEALRSQDPRNDDMHGGTFSS